MPEIQKLFCDLDGTLIDVSERNYQVYAEVTKDFGGTPLDKGTYWDLKRRKAKWPTLLPMSRLPADIEADYLGEFINKIESLDYLELDTLMPGVIEAVEEMLVDREVYLVSLRRNHRNLVAQLGNLGLEAYFTKILSGHSETDGFDRKIELINEELEGKKGAIIGDTEADIVTGKRLGMISIALLSGIRDEQFLRDLEPDHLLSDIRDAPQVLAQY